MNMHDILITDNKNMCTQDRIQHISHIPALDICMHQWGWFSVPTTAQVGEVYNL